MSIGATLIVAKEAAEKTIKETAKQIAKETKKNELKEKLNQAVKSAIKEEIKNKVVEEVEDNVIDVGTNNHAVSMSTGYDLKSKLSQAIKDEVRERIKDDINENIIDSGTIQNTKAVFEPTERSEKNLQDKLSEAVKDDIAQDCNKRIEGYEQATDILADRNADNNSNDVFGKTPAEYKDPRKIEVPEMPKAGIPPIHIIKPESSLEIVEENKTKIDAVSAALDENSETYDGYEKTDNAAEDNDTSDANESNDEGKELTEGEINEKQKAAIKDALERIKNGEVLTNEELGNLGEMMMDQYYILKGYKPLNKHRVTSLDDKKGGFKTGIDGVYEKTNPDGTKTYVIADAKYNTSQLSETNDGKQMSESWIDKRLDDAVGKEKADEIRDAAEDDPNSVKHEVYHIDPTVDENGNTHTDIQAVDSMGNKIGEKIIVEYYDEAGNRVDPPEINKAKEAEQ